MIHINEIIPEMKSMSKLLMPYTYPRVPTEEENDINYFKIREVIVDGYEMILHFSRAAYPDYYLETLQITGKYVPFLPFRLVCKLGRKFLGDRCLGFVEFYTDTRRKYCWTLVLDEKEQPTPFPHQSKAEHRVFDGLEYDYLEAKEVNFY